MFSLQGDIIPVIVSEVLRLMGLPQDPHYINYHRVLSRVVWNPLQGSRVLLGLILKLLPADAPVVIGADNTIERRFRWFPACARMLLSTTTPIPSRKGNAALNRKRATGKER